MTDAQQNIVRPTEAQLRWAGFHFKSRASRVKVAVEKIYQQPLNVRDVEGAFSEDGNTTEESSSSCSEQKRRRPKPKVSRGRRALLRVSKRKLAKRKEEIERRGFAGGDRWGTRTSASSDNEDEALESIFAEESFQKRRRKRRRNFRSAKEADQVRRFEAAFHSMMKNLEASQKPRHVIETPTRIWTRPEGAQSMESLDYSAMKMMGSHHKPHNPHHARWSFYYNADEGRGMSNREGHPIEGLREPTHEFDMKKTSASPARKRFKDIVTEFQHRLRSPLPEDLAMNVPTMKLSKYFLPAKLGEEEEDQYPANDENAVNGNLVRSRTAAFMRQQTKEQLDSVMNAIDPQLLKEMEELDPGVTDRLRALYLGEDSPRVNVKAFAKDFESPIQQKSSRRGGFVTKFAAFIENAIKMRQEELVAVDGKLQKAAFARLVNQYLLETGHGKAKRDGGHFGSQFRESSKVSELAHVITSNLNGSGDEDKETHILDTDGTLNKTAFGDMVTRYLSEATGVDEEMVRQVEDLESLATLSFSRNALYEESNLNNHDHIVSISDQLAVDYSTEIEALMKRSSTFHDDIPSEVEELTKHFLVQNCGVQPDEYEKSHNEEPALFRTVLTLRDSSVSAIRSFYGGNFDKKEYESRVCSHFVRFFEASLASADPVEDHAAKTRARRTVLVEDLISRIQHASTVEQLVTPEGTLEVSVIANLMQRYLASASQQNNDGSFLQQAQSPLALAQMRRVAGSRRSRNDNDSSDMKHLPMEPIGEETASLFVSRCIRDLSSQANGEVIVTVDGVVDELKLGQLLRRSFNPDYFVTEQSVKGIAGLTNAQSDQGRTLGKSALMDESSKPQDDRSKPVGKIVKSVSKSIGGLMKRFYKGEDDEMEELRAYSAFRTIRDTQSDDVSSHASFRFDAINKGLNKLGGSSWKRDSVETTSKSDSRSPNSEVDSSFMSRKGELLSSILDSSPSDRSIIDTDGQSDVGASSLHQDRIKNLLLSPAIITKRHRQAIRCIENRQWKEVQYLISANPW